ncbi:MAG: aminotransferase class I/II-fold pyridoxal phosphate-dependent enzyme [Kiritimatiellae bacterium]|jgi:O-acetylhomoserine (thiol)-lyase|nr:aminotransferase class I/II-fold pyridoxal phosphate-dependent enzyme [Kiritimatiellia bacterium]
MKIDTLCVQGGYRPECGEPRQVPIYQTTTFKYDTTQHMADLFDLKASGYFYTRLANPTNDQVAKKIAALEGGVAAMLTSSGQAASTYSILNLCSAGDHVVSSAQIYGGTFNLFAVSLKKLGIEFTFVDPDADAKTIQAAFRPNTKCVFGETVANPSGVVLDIAKFAKIAHKNGVPLIVDNTFPTPILCRPIEFGADIVTHATTKYMDGHSSQVGGCIVDSGNFNWGEHADKFPGLVEPDESYHGLSYWKKFGKLAFITKCTAQLMRDFGSIPSPFNAFLVNLGLESLHVRIRRHAESALKIAKWLKTQKKVAWVNFAGLPDSKYRKLLKKQFDGNSPCGVMTFGIKGGRKASIKFMDALKMIGIVTHVADAWSCVLHPASHTHRQLTDKQLMEAGIPPDLIRLSIGLEDPDDLIADLKQALAKV